MPGVTNPSDRRLKANRQQPAVRSALLMANAKNSRTETNEIYRDPEAKSGDPQFKVTAARYGRFPVYKLTAKGCIRIEINAQSLAEVLSQGNYSDVCFDCGEADCLYETQVKGEVSTNQCAGKPTRQSRICPESSCRKRIYDPVPPGQFLDEGFSEAQSQGTEGIIDDDALDQSTPASRTLAKLQQHIVGFHTDLAAELGLSKVELPKLAVV